MSNKPMLEAALFTTAFKLLSLGFSVIPSGGGDKHKAPLVAWRDYQTTTPDESQLEAWERELNPTLWGIVTTDCVAVIDADTQDTRASLEDDLGEPHVVTPRGGAHWYFDTSGHPLKTVAGLLPGIDVRAVGGFVNIAGTRLAYTDEGVEYPAADYIINKLPVPDDTLIPWGKLPKHILAALNSSKPVSKAEAIPEGQPIVKGQRNATLTSLAGTMRRRGMSQEAIEAALLTENKRCQPRLEEVEVKAIAQSVGRYAPNGLRTCMYNASQQDETEAKRNKNATENATGEAEARQKTQQAFLSKRVEEWVRTTAGWFDTPELDRELGISSVAGKNNRREIMLRLEAKGVIERHTKISRQFRYINTRVTSLYFKTAATAGVLLVRWPLNIEKYVNLFPGNVVVVAGAPNSGKTALLLDFIRLNQDKFPVYYFCSEMGPVELRNRLDQFPGMGIEDWAFEAFERASAFADVIRPDCINVIDYLEMTTELYAINEYLTAISHKIGDGLAVVAVQKKENAQYGRGQEFGLEKPKLYLSMDRGKLQIVKGKSWATKNVDPNGLRVNFKIIGGCHFEATGEWGWVK